MNFYRTITSEMLLSDKHYNIDILIQTLPQDQHDSALLSFHDPRLEDAHGLCALEYKYSSVVEAHDMYMDLDDETVISTVQEYLTSTYNLRSYAKALYHEGMKCPEGPSDLELVNTEYHHIHDPLEEQLYEAEVLPNTSIHLSIRHLDEESE